MNTQSHRFTNEKLIEILSLSQNATAIYTGEEITIQTANDVMIGFWGKDRSVIGKPLAEAVPELIGQPFIGMLREVWLTGVTCQAKDAATELLVNGKLQTFYFDYVYRAITNQAGEVDCILHTATDVTELNLSRNLIARANEQQVALEREHALNNELSSVNEELGASNEELSAALEELSSTNEELQKTKENLQLLNDVLENRVADRTKTIADLNQELEAFNEELSASNEELASANEELVTTNEELSASRERLEKLVTELAQNENRTRSIIEAAPFPIGIYTGREMRITFANKAITDVWGKGEDVIDKLYADILPELDNQEVFNQLEAVFITGVPFVARNQRLDLVVTGELKTYYFNYNFTALTNETGEVYGVMNTAADVTDAILAKQQVEETSYELAGLNEQLASVNEELAALNEEQNNVNKELAGLNEKLKMSQDELLLAIDAAGLATFDLNPVTGRFVGNNLLKSWFGLAPEDEIELQKATSVIAEADRERVVAAIEYSMSYGSGGDYDTYYTINNPLNNTPRIVRAKGKASFNEEQQPIRLSGVLQDVTELKQDEQRKNDFIGMVSHELKTPLTSLSAYVQILQSKAKKNEDSFTAGALDMANKQVRKMTTMINGFLNVSRLESGKIHIDKQRFDMAVLVKEVEEESIITITSHQVVFAPVEETIVNADRDKIGQVINNFISNAVKYSPAGSTINVACITLGQLAQITVKDQGIGIKPEDQHKLFDRYYRVKDQPATIAGFGIGLYVCAEIIHRHKGNIWVESKIGEGSTFYFNLPI